MGNTITSTQFTINKRDLIKGLIVAVITPVFTIIIDSLNQNSLSFNWKAIGITALSAGFAYVIKNFLTPAKIIVTDVPKTVVEDVKKGISEVTVTQKE